MVPFRAIAEGLGAVVGWNEFTSSAYIQRDGITIDLPVGVPLPDDMGTPIIVDGRTFVPVRYVSEVLGAGVEWNGVTRAVYVY